DRHRARRRRSSARRHPASADLARIAARRTAARGRRTPERGPPRSMKCPKCGYLGFEHVERCRNCGYDFSLTPSTAVAELPIRSNARDLRPLDDLSLVDAATAPPP